MNGLKIDTTKLSSWDDVTKFIDNGSWYPAPSWFEHVIQHQGTYPRDAFSKGQLASKSWLLRKLDKVYLNHLTDIDPTIAILGCWIGTLVDPLLRTYMIERIYGIDVDPVAIELSEKLNHQYVHDAWKYKGVVADMSVLSTDQMEFTTSGELINVKPDWVINTSCEHMDCSWFETADSSQLIIMQTNNSSEFEGHINTCESIEEMKEKYPLDNVLYIGELTTPAYTRFMQIGFKKRKLSSK